jgi:hypothetical protein
MPCISPIPAGRDEDGLIQLFDSLSEARLSAVEYLEVPCGQCGECLLGRARDWAIRCHHEALMHTRLTETGGRVPNNAFITLTYDERNLPSDGQLRKKDFQDFLKRLRYRHDGGIRYLHAGEYGGQTGRPHHHAILFGIDFHECRIEHSREGDNILYVSPALTDCWGKGFCSIGVVNFATASYVARYCTKKQVRRFNPADYFFDEDGRVKPKFVREYNTMSRRPGLGTSWFERYWSDVYPADEVVINGNTYRPPKFYDQLLFRRDPSLYDLVISARSEHCEQKGPTSEIEVEARKLIHKARDNNRKERGL